jgi:hypothetical protein
MARVNKKVERDRVIADRVTTPEQRRT